MTKLTDNILEIDNLSIEVASPAGSRRTVVDRISFKVPKGLVTAIVGESGSGKTLTALASIGLLPDGVRASAESRVLFGEKDLCRLPASELRAIRGMKIGMVFQDPSASLNPVLPIGEQVALPLRAHLGLTKRQARSRAVELLREVDIPLPEQRAGSFPHEFSGGQKQRILIAMAISCSPALLIADEPTSALDVTVQRQIIDLLARLRRDHGLGIMFITHDLALAAEIADQVVVMRQGRICERGEKNAVLFAPSDEYTQSLVRARSRLSTRRSGSVRHGRSVGETSSDAAVLTATELRKCYSVRAGLFRRRDQVAVDRVSFSVRRGETLGIVGESGSGKTTTAMMLVRLVRATSGSVVLDGKQILGMPSRAFRPLRRRIQVIFQNPFSSLNPRWTVGRILTSAMIVHGIGASTQEREGRAIGLLCRVGLRQEAMDKYPHQFSGGELQRIAIARCLALEPEVLICDECVSALDVSIQGQVLDLLRELQVEYNLAYLFISHDMTVIRHVSDQVLVMKDGSVVEFGPTESVFEAPAHPYTRNLLDSVPRPVGWQL